MAANVVAASQPLAAQAGLTMLEKGGSAADAAIAAAATLMVVEPVSSGLGADAFALISHRGEILGLNAHPDPRHVNAFAPNKRPFHKAT